MDWKDEPRAIKAALRANGFNVISAKKGTGTARCWNKIKVADKYNDWNKTVTEANRIGEMVCGHDKVNINVA